MILKIHEPQGSLSNMVKSIIFYTGYTAGYTYEKLLPDGNAQLVITLDEQPRFAYSKTGQLITLKNSWISGIRTEPITFKGEIDASSICIQFKPYALGAFSDIPSVEFKDEVVQTTEIGLPGIDRLREKLMVTKSHDAIITMVEEFLQEKLWSDKDQYFIDFVKRKLCFENRSVAEISNMAGYSQKHVIAKFRNLVGLSPKRYQRLSRVNKAIGLMQGTSLNQSAISQLCNYFDQAHFINDFRAFTSMSPTKYLSNEIIYPHVIGDNSSR